MAKKSRFRGETHDPDGDAEVQAIETQRKFLDKLGRIQAELSSATTAEDFNDAVKRLDNLGTDILEVYGGQEGLEQTELGRALANDFVDVSDTIENLRKKFENTKEQADVKDVIDQVPDPKGEGGTREETPEQKIPPVSEPQETGPDLVLKSATQEPSETGVSADTVHEETLLNLETEAEPAKFAEPKTSASPIDSSPRLDTQSSTEKNRKKETRVKSSGTLT